MLVTRVDSSPAAKCRVFRSLSFWFILLFLLLFFHRHPWAFIILAPSYIHHPSGSPLCGSRLQRQHPTDSKLFVLFDFSTSQALLLPHLIPASVVC